LRWRSLRAASFTHPGHFSAGELVAMFHTYFLGSSEGLLFDVPRDDYDSCLWSPLRGYLERLGAEVRTAETVTWVDASQELLGIGLASGAVIEADARVLATDLATSRRLARESALGDEAWRERIAATHNAPPFAVSRLSLDRPVALDRAAFLGTSGFGPLDNISVLERFEGGAPGAGRQLVAVRLSSCTRTHYPAAGRGCPEGPTAG
jgi:carotenoid phi-ring synthase / carotenoid chi-ring synthase